MLYRGSYLNGLAPRDFEPAYPELWRGCVGAWCPSLGPTGGVLRDWSGRQNHGTLTGMTLDTAWSNQQGYCLSLDGTDDYVNAGAAQVTSATQQFSWSAWVNLAADGTFPMVISQGSASFELRFSGSSRQPQWTMAGVNIVTSADAISTGTWHHLVGTYDGSASIELFVNAVSKGTAACIGTASSADIHIGARTGAFPLSGKIDDVRIYNRLLSFQERWLLYSNGRGRGIAYLFNQPRGSLTAGESSGSSGGTFPGVAWRALKRWRFVVRAGVDGNWPRVT